MSGMFHDVWSDRVFTWSSLQPAACVSATTLGAYARVVALTHAAYASKLPCAGVRI